MNGADQIAQCEAYLRVPRGPYDARKLRYQVAGERLFDAKLSNWDVLVDVGAGRTELDLSLRRDYGWRGRYVPVDGWLDGTDLNTWDPPRDFDWFAALEVLEHLGDPARLVRALQRHATKGIVITTPNPEVWDVRAMDPTHVSPLSETQLREWGFDTTKHTFYGKYQDGLAGIWTPPGTGFLPSARVLKAIERVAGHP